MSHTTTHHTLIQAPDLLVMPGVFDGFSARLVEQTGFAAGFITDAGLSETLLGYSDVGLMGFELNLAAVTRLAACCTIPLLADADTSYGNAVNVYHTTRAFEQAGLAGLMIEDQTWPKREVVEAVDGQCEVYLDGGIRRGTDVLKALALGARAVLIGRPLFWGLAVDGEAGVRAVLQMLRDELEMAMGMCGRPTIASIDRGLLGTVSPLLSVLQQPPGLQILSL